jgi:hypothetical protein
MSSYVEYGSGRVVEGWKCSKLDWRGCEAEGRECLGVGIDGDDDFAECRYRPIGGRWKVGGRRWKDEGKRAQRGPVCKHCCIYPVLSSKSCII